MVEDAVRLGYVLIQTQIWMPVIPISSQRFNRQRIDCAWADHRFYVLGIAVGRVFCACAGPQQLLSLRTFVGKFLKTVTAENCLVHLVCDFGACDRHLSM